MNNDTSEYVKPVSHIQALIDSFLTVHSLRKAKAGQRFQVYDTGKNFCFLLVNGKCDIVRSDDSLLIVTAEAPYVLGSAAIVAKNTGYFLRAKTDIEYLHIPLEDFNQHVDRHNLWKHVAYVIASVTVYLNNYHRLHTAVPTYTLICNLLRQLHDQNFETRATVSAVSYIQDRTSLSRSIVMKTLAELNSGGYIVIKRGLLIKINSLPEKF